MSRPVGATSVAAVAAASVCLGVLLPATATAAPNYGGYGDPVYGGYDDPVYDNTYDSYGAAPTPYPYGPGLGGCSLDLPGGADRDSGLSQMYMDNQQGRDWLLVPMLTVREVYSDNVGLAPPGEEESDFITQVIPGVTLCTFGSRVQAQAHYEVQGLYYARDQDRNQVYQQFNGQASAELVQNHFFVDAGTSYSQQVIDASQAFSTSNVLDTSGNRTNAWSVSVSPYLRQSLGPVGLATLRYGYRYIAYDTSQVSDATSQSVGFTVVNPPTTDTWSWVADYQTTRVERDDHRTTEFATASLQLGYQLTARIELLARGGVENDYMRDGTVDEWGSTFWDAGFRWVDNRTVAEFRYGHRFFGPTYMAEISHQGARLFTALSYTESPQVVSRLQFQDEFGNTTLPGAGDDFRNPPFFQEPGSAFPDAPLTRLNSNEVFVRKRFGGRALYDTGRTQTQLSAFAERREFQISGAEEQRRGFDVFWRWQMFPRTALIPRYSWQRIEFETGQVDYLSQAQISVAHLLSPTMQTGVTLRHQERNSSAERARYDENAIILEVTKLF